MGFSDELRKNRMVFYEDDVAALNKIINVFLDTSKAECVLLIDVDVGVGRVLRGLPGREKVRHAGSRDRTGLVQQRFGKQGLAAARVPYQRSGTDGFGCSRTHGSTP